MDNVRLRKSAKNVVENAARLLEDAVLLEEMTRYPSAYALCILAQEEYGKAFLLFLAQNQSVPWTLGLQKALRNHHCKQLVALLLDYMQRKDFLELLNEPDRFGGARTLPQHVMDAIHIIVHEHIRENDRDSWLDEKSNPHPLANRIAEGVLDRSKQTAFYVQLGWDGSTARTPKSISEGQCREEIARTERIKECFWIRNDELEAGASFDLPKIVATFEVLSGVMALEDFNENHW